MAWNGSDGGRGTRPACPQGAGANGGGASRTSRPTTRVILALALIVIGGGLAWWFVAGRRSPVPDVPVVPDVPSLIKEHQPSPASTTTAAQDAPKKPTGRVTAKGTPIPDRVQPDERGVLRYPNGQRWADPNDLHIVKHPQKRKLFKRTCDNQLAILLTLDPTKMAPFLVGRRRPYGDTFAKDFRESLNDTYEADPDDTEEERAVRQMVIETRAELKAAMDRGEDIAQIMNATQEELDRLCQYRDTLKKELKDIQYDETVSDEAFEDFVKAANLMLEKQGLKGLTMPSIVTRQARIQKMKELLSQKDQ